MGTRPDGYHELRTIFQSIALHDTLTIRPVPGPFALECHDRGCPADRTNLVWQAAEGLWKASGKRGAARDVSIHLKKRIPMQAGLGGGSSDAAATLVALSKVWRVDFERVKEVAVSLGADVPYFLEGGTVLGLDRGDLLFPLLDGPRLWVTLAIPPFRVSTKEAFAWWDRAPRQEGSGNDLEAVVTARYPEIARLISLFRVSGASDAAMSGSGSAVFGIFPRRSDALSAARTLSGGDHKIIVTRTLNRAEYQRFAGSGVFR
jgi:4-diphosphocytidyl-2-C-methyl-D-erythritol kinase